MNIFTPQRHREYHFRIFTDGSIRPARGASGLAAVVWDGNERRTCAWWSRKAGKLTCNEAEYAAAILALEQLCAHLSPRVCKRLNLLLLSDSQVMVDQMRGAATAHAPGLRRAQMDLRLFVMRFGKVTFQHIPRQDNRLADALANNAVDGKESFVIDRDIVKSSIRPRRNSWKNIWRK